MRFCLVLSKYHVLVLEISNRKNLILLDSGFEIVYSLSLSDIASFTETIEFYIKQFCLKLVLYPLFAFSELILRQI